MILIATPSMQGDWARAIHHATQEEIVVAGSLGEAANRLRSESYAAVVMDQFLLETEPQEVEPVMEHLGTAMPLQFSFAVCGVERLAREIRAAVQRRKREEVAARRAVEVSFHTELNGTVTALLLSCEMALGAPGLPREAAENLKSAHTLVKRLRSRLGEMAPIET